MACNCPGAGRSARLSTAATKKATRLANAGIKIPTAKKVRPKKVQPKKVKPCPCT